VDALHMVPGGVSSEKPLAADGTEAVRNARCLHWVFADKLVEFFRACEICSKIEAWGLRQINLIV